MGTAIALIIIVLKFILPVLIYFFPFAAGWANFVLDTIDGDLLIPLGIEDYTYQTIDKLADYTTYIAMLLVGLKLPIKREIIATFALRTIGQLLFFISRDELVFFFFPNLLEPLFLIFVTIAFFKKSNQEAYKVYKKYWWLIWGGILIYKFQDEWITHVGNVDRTELVKRWLGLE